MSSLDPGLLGNSSIGALVTCRAARDRLARIAATVHVNEREPMHGDFVLRYAEHLDPRTGKRWGGFVQTCSMDGVVNAAQRLGIPRGQAF